MVISTTENVLSTDNPESSNIPHIILTDDEVPFAELEGFLSGSIKSSPKSAKSSSDESLECRGRRDSEPPIRHASLRSSPARPSVNHLDKLLNCQSQLLESAKLLPLSMKTTLIEFMTKFPLTWKVIAEYEYVLAEKQRIFNNSSAASVHQTKLFTKMAEGYKKSVALDKDIHNLQRQLNEKVVQKAQLDQVLARCFAERQKINEDAKIWVAQSKTIILTLKDRKSEYSVAIATKKIYKNTWAKFRIALSHPRLS